MQRIILIFMLSAACAKLESGAPGPIFGRVFVAAGLGEPAYKDGEFGAAAFNAPAALAVSKDGKFLYVADTGNNAIRRVSFELQSKVDTIAGGPGKADAVSPTALALTLDGSALYAVVGAQGTIVRLSVQGGTVTAFPNEVSPLAATSLAQHPEADRLYALNGAQNTLTVIAPAAGKSVTLSLGEGFGGAQGSMVASGHGLYFLRRGTGELLHFTVSGRALAGIAFEELSDQKVLWERLGYLGAGARGMVAELQEPQKQWLLWVWDQETGRFRQFNHANGDWDDYPLKDYAGNWLVQSVPFARTPYVEDYLYDSQRRPMFKGDLSIAGDPARGVFYLAEPQGNRILGLSHPRWDHRRDDGMSEYENKEKVPGVTRILLLGDSMVTSDDTHAGERAMVESGFGKKLELYLNTFSSAKGKGRRFEVLQHSVALGALGGGVTAFLANLPHSFMSLKPDEVITLLTYGSIHCELLAMTRTKSPDDVPTALVDPFFFDQSSKEMLENYGPVHRDFLNWVKKAPPEILRYVSANAASDRLDIPAGLYTTDAFRFPEYRAWVLKVHAKVVAKALETAKGAKMRYTQVLLPMRNQLAPSENVSGGYYFSETTGAAWLDPDLAKVAGEQGIDFINLTPSMRALQPTVFPMMGYGTQHYKMRGIEWAAMLTALAYIDKLP